MLPPFANPLWVEEDCDAQHQHQHQDAPPPTPMVLGQEQQNLLALAHAADMGTGVFSAQPVLDDDWYFNPAAAAGAAAQGPSSSLLLAPPPGQGQGMSLGATASSSQVFSLFNMAGGCGGAPFDLHGFDLGLSGGCGGGGGGVSGGELVSFGGAGGAANSAPLSSLIPSGNAGFLGSFGGFGTAPAPMPEFGGLGGFDMFGNGSAGGCAGSSAAAAAAAAAPPDSAAQFSARGKAAVLRPLEIFPPVGAQPTLFQKRALRRNAGEEDDDKKRKAGALAAASPGGGGDTVLDGADDDDDDDGGSIGASGGLNYDSEDARGGVEESGGKKGDKDSNANSTVTAGGAGEGKGGKRKGGMPAKNLMAERRRRKKLNDRLYMLRSVVPKISKMDRASILGDAIEYLKELLQKINDLQAELESPPSTASLPPTPTSFHPLTPTLPTLPSRVKEELCTNALPSPTSQQPRVEVRMREGRAVNIHMFCARRPGLLLNAMRAIEGLGLDVQQAVASCFNGFTLDVFKAELCRDGPGLLPEDIKTVLLQSTGFHGVM
ncbi:unnamed protein product [Urochloa decumbens]|uniref:BHLH domain-containing protein n=1 Tax=Urochloa decumbens TaxID=240449 RepID=A0ABC9B6Z2_9POAL